MVAFFTALLQMKKTLRKPENWQDFELLCKKLFGEVWNCKNTIKKNGRAGQAQAGVDVYGVPKGEEGYFGIQCKGKDDYTQAQLSTSEIIEEIAKARTFEPPLKTFLIATSANKDAQIETFIRKEDLKSRKEGGFEIVYYAWEDLVDLIEENRETFQWYVAGQQFRNQHEVEIQINGSQEAKIEPEYFRNVKIFQLKEDMLDFSNPGLQAILAINRRFESSGIMIGRNYNKPRQFNYTWCPVQIAIINTGAKVLEDWKLEIEIEKEHIKGLMKEYEGEKSDHFAALAPISITALKLQNQTVFIDGDDATILYKPLKPVLIQRDKKSFSFWLQPSSHDVGSILIKWRLLARDFSAEGKLTLNVAPKFERRMQQVEVDPGDLREKEETYTDKVAPKEE